MNPAAIGADVFDNLKCSGCMVEAPVIRKYCVLAAEPAFYQGLTFPVQT